MDLIDRQEAIDRIEAIFPVDPHANECAEGVAIGAALAKQYIETLPSAQPEIIRCRDCRYWGAYPSSSATPWLHECYARIARLHTAADEFCSRAERREVSE